MTCYTRKELSFLHWAGARPQAAWGDFGNKEDRAEPEDDNMDLHEEFACCTPLGEGEIFFQAETFSVDVQFIGTNQAGFWKVGSIYVWNEFFASPPSPGVWHP